MAQPKYSVQTCYRVVKNDYIPISEATSSEGEAQKLAAMLNNAVDATLASLASLPKSKPTDDIPF